MLSSECRPHMTVFHGVWLLRAALDSYTPHLTTSHVSFGLHLKCAFGLPLA